jgi:hypothetical protein
VLVEQGREELVVGRVPPAAGQVEAADKGHESTEARIGAGRISDDAFLGVDAIINICGDFDRFLIGEKMSFFLKKRFIFGLKM